ncbi:MHYT domain-containing protein [Frankia sp. Cppng1_Ct_nod]|uniref:MHYT domain-containing protein n=1 Tax=Frankia sp. Cppng1_Ct_nod TaxID=2897162 RepID=UPI0020249D3F|nr:MHYT domain-containing protein [Frankia sp. Cppng1_Ct_nod]
MTTTVRALGRSAAENLPAVHTHFQASYHLGFVGLSYVLAALGSFAALASAARIRATRGSRRLWWVTVTAVALGGGAIWSMHFVGMLAYHIEPGITFALPATALSLGISIVGAGIGLGIVANNPANTTRLIGGGVLAGFAITAMHYTGMAAMRTAGTISYRPPLVALSVLIAVVAATAAFSIAFHVGGTQRVLGASGVMALAVCGMHYTAMAATQVTPDPALGPAVGVGPFSLGILTTFTSSIIMIFIICAALGEVTNPEVTVPPITPKPGQHRPGTQPDSASPPMPESTSIGPGQDFQTIG